MEQPLQRTSQELRLAIAETPVLPLVLNTGNDQVTALKIALSFQAFGELT